MTTDVQRYDVCVAGGGIAGLVCCSMLARKGLRVALIEKRPYLGGRASVLPAPPFIDNSPHVMSGAYRALRWIMKTVGSPLNPPENPQAVNWYDQDRLLVLPNSPSLPIRLLKMLGRFGISDTARLVRLSRGCRKPLTVPSTAEKWLAMFNLSDTVLSMLRLFTLSALNTPLEVADAELLRLTMRMTLFASGDGALMWRVNNLEQSIISPLRANLDRLGVQVFCGKPMESLHHNSEGCLCEFDGRKIAADNVVLAMPADARSHFIAENKHPGSTIVSARCRVRTNLRGWFGFSDLPIHWVFIGDGDEPILEAVTSADNNSAIDKETRFQIIESQLKKLDSAFQIIDKLGVVVEKRATPLQTIEWSGGRPTPWTGTNGIWRAGDDLATGLPATMESAAVSGLWAALAIAGKSPSDFASPCSESVYQLALSDE